MSGTIEILFRKNPLRLGKAEYLPHPSLKSGLGSIPDQCLAPFRMETSEIRLLRDITRARGEDISDFVRRAVKTELARLSYLSAEEKKALGIRDEAIVDTPES